MSAPRGITTEYGTSIKEGNVKRFSILALAALISCQGILLASQSNEVGDRVIRATLAIREVANIPENGIPQDLLDKCACVAVIPSMKKAGFIFGGNYGKGLISCRTNNGEGPWSAPSMLSMGGGSFGLQIGAQATDLVLVVMNVRGIESLLDSKITLGGDASVAAGPVGRTAQAETDAWMSAKILAYSRSRGLFGGITLKGGWLRPDHDANHVLYGKKIQPRDMLFQPAGDLPRDAKIFFDELTKISPKKVN